MREIVKKFCTVLSVVFVACTIINVPTTGITSEVSATEASQEAGNLVVLVRFAGDTRDDTVEGYNREYSSSISGAPKTEWEKLTRMFNGENDSFAIGSFREYFRDMSGGQHDVMSYFPQSYSDGTVKYIDLPSSVDTYTEGATGDAILIKDINEQLNKNYSDFDISKVDKDSDGVIDNLMIIASVQESGKFTAHTSNAGATESFNGKKIGPYNILESKTSVLSSGTFWDTFNILTASHEYIHTFDIPDYYRSSFNVSGQDNPVGTWDLMAMPGKRPYPLAVTRENIGWTTIKEVPSATATYTLYDNESAYEDSDKEQAIKFKTQMNTNEYFVIEFRKSGKQYTNQLDQEGTNGISADGIIVYRVNPAYEEEGNLKGNDYIYVYRPGETGINDSAGDVTKAQLGLEGYNAVRTSIGTDDLSADITRDALCYSDGQNSGVKIEVKKQTDSSITFDITFPDYENIDLWEQVTNSDGSNAFTGVNSNKTKLVSTSNSIYAMASDTSYKPTVLKYDGSDWISLGQAGTSMYEPSIDVDGCEVYVVGADYKSDTVVLRKYSEGSWSEAARISNISANTPLVKVIDGEVYVLADNGGSNVKLYKLEGDSLNVVGDTLDIKYISNPTIFNFNGNPAIAYGDFMASPQKTEVKVLKDGKWTTIYSDSEGSANVNSVQMKDGKIYLFNLYNNGATPKLTIIGNEGTEDTYNIAELSSSLTSGDMVVGDDYVYYSVINNQEAITYSAQLTNPTNISKLGETVSKPVGCISSALKDGIIYNGINPETNGTVDVKKHFALDKKETVELTEPTGKEGLIYNGQSQELVTNGTVTKGKVLYKIGDGAWSEAVPTGKNAGDYNVSYKVVSESADILCQNTMNVTIEAKKVTLKITPNGGTVGNVKAATVSVGGAEKDENPNVVITYYGSGYESTKVPTTEGNYTVTAEVDDNNYKADKVTAEFVIKKKSSPYDDLSEVSLKNGWYTISSKANSSYVLDISGGSENNGANLQIWKSNKTNAQKFYIESAGNGLYTIKTGTTEGILSLDVSGGNFVNGGNVQQWESNGTAAQKWKVYKASDGSYVFLTSKGDKCIDISEGKIASGQNVHIWDYCGNNNQKWNLTQTEEVAPYAGLTRTNVETGWYTISSKANSSHVLDISGGSENNGANLQIWKSNKTNAQKFYIESAGNGLYTIKTGTTEGILSLDVSGGNFINGGNVQQWENNGTAAQKWKVYKASDGSYVFLTSKGDKCIDISEGKTVSGQNVHIWDYCGNNNQKWHINRTTSPLVYGDLTRTTVSEGWYTISSGVNKNYKIDVSGASRSNGSNIQLWGSNNSYAQKFYIKSAGNGEYIIRTGTTNNSVLDVTNGRIYNGSNVQQYAYNGTDAQRWKIYKSTDGKYVFMTSSGQKVLDVSGGMMSNGTNIQIWDYAKVNNQKWNLIKN